MPKIIPIQKENEVINNIFYLLKTRGKNQSELAQYLGISKNSITQWKTGRTSSYLNYIDQMAVFFNISSEDLLHPKEVLCESFLSPEEIDIIHCLRSSKNSDTIKLVSMALKSLVNN